MRHSSRPPRARQPKSPHRVLRRVAAGRVRCSPLEPKFWDNFCDAVERPGWKQRRYEPLPQTALIKDVSALFASCPLAHWDALLPEADCCYHAVLTLDEQPDHPHVAARQLIGRTGRWTGRRRPRPLEEGLIPPSLDAAAHHLLFPHRGLSIEIAAKTSFFGDCRGERFLEA